MRKRFMTSMTLLLSLGLGLLGCATSQETASNQNAVQNSSVTPAGQFPITNQKVTLTVMIKGSTTIQDFATNAFTKWYEDKTNVHINWEVAPSDGKEAQSKLNLELSSGSYPDIIMDFGITPTQQMIEGQQGVFLPLNKLIDQYGVELKKQFQQDPTIKDAITAPDGNIYALPNINQCYQCSMSQKLWIYKPWLDQLGLKVPETTDEFYQVLKAFKEKDPNGNGKPDEIPLSGAIDGWNTSVTSFLMNSFIYNNEIDPNGADGSHLILTNGKIQAAFNQPQWREGLQYLHKLYTEKLIDPQVFTQKSDQLKQLAENPNVPILGAVSAGALSTFSQIGSASGRWLQYVAVPPLKGPEGIRTTAYNASSAVVGQFVITNASKYPDLAFRWADGLYNEEVSFLSQYGIEGKDWKKADPSEVGLDGKPAGWDMLVPFGKIQNDHWNSDGLFVTTDKLRLSQAADPKTPALAGILYKSTQENYAPYIPKPDLSVPLLFFTNEQSQKLADLSKAINDYLSEMTTRFITGDANLDKDWEAYIAQLNQIGLQDYLKIYQDAYNAKYKK